MLIDKDKYRVYNNRTSKNRGIKMEEKQRIRLLRILLIIIGCLVVLRFAIQMDRIRKWDIEEREQASERASEQEKKEQELEKEREAFRKKWGEEPTF